MPLFLLAGNEGFFMWASSLALVGRSGITLTLVAFGIGALNVFLVTFVEGFDAWPYDRK